MEKTKNKTVIVAVPKVPGDRLKFIMACGYPWPTGATTERVVSAEDADELVAETKASVMDKTTKKVTTMQRFTCVVAGDSDKEAAAKNPHRGMAKLTFQKNPMVEQTAALKEGLTLLAQSMSELIGMQKNTLQTRPAR